MKSLRQIKMIPLEIASYLSRDIELQKLLMCDQPQCDSFSPVDINELLKEGYLSIIPYLENGLINDNRNTFLNINLIGIEPDYDDNISIDGEIIIGTNASHVLLQNNQNRLLEIIDRCYINLADFKLSVAGQLKIKRTSFIIISENVFGYRIEFNILDQDNEGKEI